MSAGNSRSSSTSTVSRPTSPSRSALATILEARAQIFSAFVMEERARAPAICDPESTDFHGVSQGDPLIESRTRVYSLTSDLELLKLLDTAFSMQVGIFDSMNNGQDTMTTTQGQHTCTDTDTNADIKELQKKLLSSEQRALSMELTLAKTEDALFEARSTARRVRSDLEAQVLQMQDRVFVAELEKTVEAELLKQQYQEETEALKIQFQTQREEEQARQLESTRGALLEQFKAVVESVKAETSHIKVLLDSERQENSQLKRLLQSMRKMNSLLKVQQRRGRSQTASVFEQIISEFKMPLPVLRVAGVRDGASSLQPDTEVLDNPKRSKQPCLASESDLTTVIPQMWKEEQGAASPCAPSLTEAAPTD